MGANGSVHLPTYRASIQMFGGGGVLNACRRGCGKCAKGVKVRPNFMCTTNTHFWHIALFGVVPRLSELSYIFAGAECFNLLEDNGLYTVSVTVLPKCIRMAFTKLFNGHLRV